MDNELTIRENSQLAVLPSQQLSPWEEGISSLDLTGNALTKRDKEAFQGLLTVTLGGWTPETDAKATLLWSHILDKGWSAERLDQALYRFSERKFFGPNNWTLFDFFECSPENDLHDNEWYLNLSANDRERCEIFIDPSDKKCLYRYQGTGVALPKEFVKVWPK